jgi:acyl-CoA thioester hydrolase
VNGFPFETSITVRFRDVDAMGHVNNAVYGTFFEEGRVALFRKHFGVRGASDFDFIIARLEIDFRRPIRLDDEVRLGIRVAAMGVSSFTFDYRLEAAGEVAAEGRTVQVCFDYAAGRKKPLDEGFRARLEAFSAGGSS